MKIYQCKNCGAQIFFNDNKKYSQCIYCKGQVVLIDDNIKNLNIKKIIPFQIDVETAKDEFYKAYNHRYIKDIKKIYVPCQVCAYSFDYDYMYSINNSSVGIEKEEEKYSHKVTATCNNDFVFLDNRFKSIINKYSISKSIANRIDFDPVYLDDSSIDAYNEISNQDIANIITNNVKNYIKLTYNYESLSDDKLSINNLFVEDFITLVPVYLFYTSDNSQIVIPVSGCRPYYSASQIEGGQIKYDAMYYASLAGTIILNLAILCLDFLNSFYLITIPLLVLMATRFSFQEKLRKEYSYNYNFTIKGNIFVLISSIVILLLILNHHDKNIFLYMLSAIPTCLLHYLLVIKKEEVLTSKLYMENFIDYNVINK